MPRELWIIPIGKPEECFRTARCICKTDESQAERADTGEEYRKRDTKERRTYRTKDYLALHASDYGWFRPKGELSTLREAMLV
jgi:hypothetical protein